MKFWQSMAVIRGYHVVLAGLGRHGGGGGQLATGEVPGQVGSRAGVLGSFSIHSRASQLL